LHVYWDSNIYYILHLDFLNKTLWDIWVLHLFILSRFWNRVVVHESDFMKTQHLSSKRDRQLVSENAFIVLLFWKFCYTGVRLHPPVYVFLILLHCAWSDCDCSQCLGQGLGMLLILSFPFSMLLCLGLDGKVIYKKNNNKNVNSQ
jgi:hypothetical protein